jgi:chemotaxis protein MotB
MRSGPLELQPAREFAQRMHELEAELQRVRHAQRRLKADPDAPSRWGLETRASDQQEEVWFLTYLDMMTLLLVAMIVMLAFSGAATRHGQAAAARITASPPPAAHAAPGPGAPHGPPDAVPAYAGTENLDAIPAPDAALLPYPAAPADAFEQSAYPSRAMAALASAYPTPLDLSPPPPADAATAPTAAAASPDTAPVHATPAGTAAVAASPSTPALPAPAPATIASEPPQAAPAQQAPEPEKPVDAHSEGQSLAAALPLNELGSEVEVVVNKRSVSLRISSEILFGTGQADLSAHGLSVLRRMAEVLSRDGYDIMVEGHTDSVPVRSNSRYPSNWELSSARAGSVVRYLEANGIDRAHLKAVGYADTRPITGNRDADGRARNRRVELVIEKPESGAAKAPARAAPANTPPSARR